MIMRRWPNASFIDGSIWDKEDHWGHEQLTLMKIHIQMEH